MEVGWVLASGCFSHCRTHILFVCSCVRVYVSFVCHMEAVAFSTMRVQSEMSTPCKMHIAAKSDEARRCPVLLSSGLSQRGRAFGVCSRRLCRLDFREVPLRYVISELFLPEMLAGKSCAGARERVLA